jgi:hypothetical protein
MHTSPRTKQERVTKQDNELCLHKKLVLFILDGLALLQALEVLWCSSYKLHIVVIQFRALQLARMRGSLPENTTDNELIMNDESNLQNTELDDQELTVMRRNARTT